MNKVKAAVFASGTGSNFQAIIEQEIENKLACDIALLVCDKPGATVINIAEDYDIPTFVFNPKNYAAKKDYEQEVVKRLQIMNVKWIFLAGYMRIIGPDLLHVYENKIVNLHPSMLPAFPGKDAIGQAFEAGVKTTGVTVHYVDAGIDTGPIIEQKSVHVFPDDTKDTLQKRIQRVEHQLYPRVINQLIKQERGVFS
ncbi:phosphoribosylglycinamide formyltransferase [Virgibacillus oceani]|uniref:Phosphoribosylglycinamide formyltransferase n=1 Tax=Virgibacillus oceani TaxID=1479511 RepID=A0A917M2T3_9BACI|nr:phosphoribosylglycinamide formyltransferase [Virgibacillus oceani]GGG74133.1 phosphoribosylglycinamide formyltransferase [Virgibacillus oceani]